MQKILFLILAMTLFLTSCKMAEITLPDNLETTAQSYEVEGRRKIQWKKGITFGEFTAKESKKSIPWTSETNWIYKKKKGKHKFQFNLNKDNTNTTYEVVANNTVNELSIDAVTKFFGLESDLLLKVENNFSGSIKATTNDRIWNFFIADASANSYKYAKGYVSDGKTKIEIVEALEVGEGYLPKRSNEIITYGFLFYQNIDNKRTCIGAVRVYKDGRIWLKQNINPEVNDVMAGVSAALLMRNDLE